MPSYYDCDTTTFKPEYSNTEMRKIKHCIFEQLQNGGSYAVYVLAQLSNHYHKMNIKLLFFYTEI